MRVVLGSVLVAALGALGCAGGGGNAALSAAAPAAPPGEYRIQRGDELEIRFALNPEFDSDIQVLPDGTISLPLIDEVRAEGLSPTELSEQLRNAYSTELRDPDVAVNVKSIAARIYVGGHIEKPGEQVWSRQITAMQAIARAGGFRETADTSRIVVLRRDASGVEQSIEIDLEDATSAQGKSRDVYLAPYDLVMVPSSGVADVNKWVEQYIRKNIPLTPRDVVPSADGGGGGGGAPDVGQVGPCWVAEELFGPDSPDTHYARLWASTNDNAFTRLYRKHGRAWAAWLAAHPWAKPLAAPIWKAMAQAGRRMVQAPQ